MSASQADPWWDLVTAAGQPCSGSEGGATWSSDEDGWNRNVCFCKLGEGYRR